MAKTVQKLQSNTAKPELPTRTDGVQARARLVSTALRLFAHQGFERTSTRQISQEAQVNISAIAYYFGDKAGLYRAAFIEPMGGMQPEVTNLHELDLPLLQILEQFYEHFLEPLTMGPELELCMRLHFREFIEPTGLWQEEIDRDIKPTHAMLANLIAHLFGMKKPDLNIHRAVFGMIGMSVYLFVGRDVIQAVEPRTLQDNKAVHATAQRLAAYALGIVQAEAQLRNIDLKDTP